MLWSAPQASHHFLSARVKVTAPYLPVCAGTAPLASLLSMHFALIRREHRQTVLTAGARRGCCEGRELTANVNGALRCSEEDGCGEGVGGAEQK